MPSQRTINDVIEGHRHYPWFESTLFLLCARIAVTDRDHSPRCPLSVLRGGPFEQLCWLTEMHCQPPFSLDTIEDFLWRRRFEDRPHIASNRRGCCNGVTRSVMEIQQCDAAEAVLVEAVMRDRHPTLDHLGRGEFVTLARNSAQMLLDPDIRELYERQCFPTEAAIIRSRRRG